MENKKLFTMMIDIEIYQFINECAKNSHRSMKQFIVDLILEYVKKQRER